MATEAARPAGRGEQLVLGKALAAKLPTGGGALEENSAPSRFGVFSLKKPTLLAKALHFRPQSKEWRVKYRCGGSVQHRSFLASEYGEEGAHSMALWLRAFIAERGALPSEKEVAAYSQSLATTASSPEEAPRIPEKNAEKSPAAESASSPGAGTFPSAAETILTAAATAAASGAPLDASLNMRTPNTRPATAPHAGGLLSSPEDRADAALSGKNLFAKLPKGIHEAHSSPPPRKASSPEAAPRVGSDEAVAASETSEARTQQQQPPSAGASSEEREEAEEEGPSLCKQQQEDPSSQAGREERSGSLGRQTAEAPALRRSGRRAFSSFSATHSPYSPYSPYASYSQTAAALRSRESPGRLPQVYVGSKQATFHAEKHEWRARFYMGAKRCMRTFSARLYGFEVAKQKAFSFISYIQSHGRLPPSSVKSASPPLTENLGVSESNAEVPSDLQNAKRSRPPSSQRALLPDSQQPHTSHHHHQQQQPHQPQHPLPLVSEHKRLRVSDEVPLVAASSEGVSLSTQTKGVRSPSLEDSSTAALGNGRDDEESEGCSRAKASLLPRTGAAEKTCSSSAVGGQPFVEALLRPSFAALSLARPSTGPGEVLFSSFSKTALRNSARRRTALRSTTGTSASKSSRASDFRREEASPPWLREGFLEGGSRGEADTAGLLQDFLAECVSDELRSLRREELRRRVKEAGKKEAEDDDNDRDALSRGAASSPRCAFCRDIGCLCCKPNAATLSSQTLDARRTNGLTSGMAAGLAVGGHEFFIGGGSRAVLDAIVGATASGLSEFGGQGTPKGASSSAAEHALLVRALVGAATAPVRKGSPVAVPAALHCSSPPPEFLKNQQKAFAEALTSVCGLTSAVLSVFKNVVAWRLARERSGKLSPEEAEADQGHRCTDTAQLWAEIRKGLPEAYAQLAKFSEEVASHRGEVGEAGCTGLVDEEVARGRGAELVGGGVFESRPSQPASQVEDGGLLPFCEAALLQCAASVREELGGRGIFKGGATAFAAESPAESLLRSCCRQQSVYSSRLSGLSKVAFSLVSGCFSLLIKILDDSTSGEGQGTPAQSVRSEAERRRIAEHSQALVEIHKEFASFVAGLANALKEGHVAPSPLAGVASRPFQVSGPQAHPAAKNAGLHGAAFKAAAAAATTTPPTPTAAQQEQAHRAQEPSLAASLSAVAFPSENCRDAAAFLEQQLLQGLPSFAEMRQFLRMRKGGS